MGKKLERKMTHLESTESTMLLYREQKLLYSMYIIIRFSHRYLLLRLFLVSLLNSNYFNSICSNNREWWLLVPSHPIWHNHRSVSPFPISWQFLVLNICHKCICLQQVQQLLGGVSGPASVQSPGIQRMVRRQKREREREME